MQDAEIKVSNAAFLYVVTADFGQASNSSARFKLIKSTLVVAVTDLHRGCCCTHCQQTKKYQICSASSLTVVGDVDVKKNIRFLVHFHWNDIDA